MSQHTTDRELLELAARASGFGGPEHKFCWTESEYPRCSDTHGALWNYVGFMDSAVMWNPLTDDGDALRLGAALRLHILHNDPDDSVLWVSAVLNKRGFHGVVEFQDEVQRTGATRRAIVLAAAAIGEAQCAQKESRNAT